MTSGNSAPNPNLNNRTSLRQRLFPTSIRLIGGLAAFVLLGTLLLMIPACSRFEPLRIDQALFTAVSALTVTGLSVIDVPTVLTPTGKIILMCLIQTGGIGYMVFAILVFRILGRSISLTDRMALQDALGVLNLSGIVQLTKKIFVTVLSIEAIGAFALYLNWRDQMPAPKVVFYSIFHAVSSFCNAGFDLFGSQNFPRDSASLTTFGILILLGGLGIPVIFDLVTYPQYRKFSLHSRLTIITAVGLLVWGAFGIFFAETRPGGLLAEFPIGNQIGYSVFQSISCRTAGFAGIPDLGQASSATILMMSTLMFIGCAPASMGGGVTTGTFVVLLLAMVAYVRRQSTPIVQGRAIPGEMIRKASAVLTISLAVVLTASWMLMLFNGFDLDHAIFEVISAFATCGLTLDKTGELNAVGQTVIIFMMFWGRLGALTVLFAFTRPNQRRRVNFPEEKVLIG